GSKMRIVAEDIAAGGDWSRYSKLDGSNISYQGLPAELIDYKEYFFDSTFKTKLDQLYDRAEPSRKISYYTPEFKGIRLGVSYIPDSSNAGSSLISVLSAGINDISIPNTTNTYVINRNVKDAFSLGISYDYNISDGVDLKLAATGEYGRAVGNIKLVENRGLETERILNQYKLNDLKTYNIGAILNYGNFGYSGSYGTLNKSLTSGAFNKTGRGTKYYNGAIAYSQGPIKTSLSYFKSSKYKNNLNSLTLGSEYKLVPGLLPYAEVSYFQAKGKPSFYPEAPNKKIKGTVAVLGAKLKF
ncbi:MAG: porin, partial [Janthinobacterium lividum]